MLIWEYVKRCCGRPDRVEAIANRSHSFPRHQMPRHVTAGTDDLLPFGAGWFLPDVPEGMGVSALTTTNGESAHVYQKIRLYP